MKSQRMLLLSLVILALSSISLGMAETSVDLKKNMPTIAGAGVVSISNAILEAAIQTSTGASGVGTYTIRTGTNHPNPFQNVLYGGASLDPWSSYNTIKVYDTNREYVTTSRATITPDPGFLLVLLDSCNATIDIQTPTVVRIHWDTFEKIRIFQEVGVQGTTMANTKVYISVWINNFDNVAHYLGFRFLSDLMIDGWDGSWLRPSGTGPWLDAETIWAPPTFTFWQTTNYPLQPVFYIYGYYSPTPTELTFAYWQDSFKVAYLYTPSGKVIGSTVPSTGGAKDSAVLYYWGDAPIEVLPGGNTSVKQEIPPPVVPVGGVFVPVNKLGLLAPYIGLTSTTLVATVAAAVYVKRVKRRKEKQ
jgi:hypothetical protein